MDIEDAGRLHRYRASARSEHWATALTRAGRKVCDKALPNDEARLRALYDKLAGHGSLLVVVDQPATIGALAVAVAQETGITVSYLPGLSMRRIADLTPGSAKTDAKDAAVIADAARSMPHTLRSVSTSDEDAAALSMLTGSGPGPGSPGQPDGQPDSGPVVHPDPAQPSSRCWGPGRAHDAAGEARRRLAHPRHAEEGRPGTNRRQAQEARVQAARHLGRPDRLGPGAPERGGRRHRRRRSGAAAPGEPAHRPTRPTGRCRRPGQWPWRVAHPHVPGPDHPCPGSGVPAAVLAGRDPDQDLQSPEPSRPPTPAWHR